jgi:hypothetical protein
MSSREHDCPKCGKEWHCEGCDNQEETRLCDDCAKAPSVISTAQSSEQAANQWAASQGWEPDPIQAFLAGVEWACRALKEVHDLETYTGLGDVPNAAGSVEQVTAQDIGSGAETVKVEGKPIEADEAGVGPRHDPRCAVVQPFSSWLCCLGK